jgi:HD superfamily phosphohydrolase YqeK
MSSAPKNIKEYIGDLHSKKPEEVISEIRVDLESFIDKIMECNLHDLYLVGRKSRHLFHPLISSRLVEKSSGIHFLNVRGGIKNGTTVCLIDSPGGVPSEICLLADSIDEGKEKEEIVNILRKQCGCNVTKIFCYVANQQGINYLISKNIFTEDQIIAFHTIPNSEYRHFNNRLEMYYQSRIEPMDVDHVFKVCSFATKISNENLFRLFKNATKTVLGCSIDGFSEAKEIDEQNVEYNILFVPSTIKNYNFDCFDFSSCRLFCRAEMSKNFTSTAVEYVQIRLKAELKETETTLCLMVLCPPDPASFSIDTIKTSNCMNTTGCPVQRSVYDRSELSQDETMMIVCPQCIEKQLSDIILESVMKEFKYNVEQELN